MELIMAIDDSRASQIPEFSCSHLIFSPARDIPITLPSFSRRCEVPIAVVGSREAGVLLSSGMAVLLTL
jgi:hypothetical protein